MNQTNEAVLNYITEFVSDLLKYWYIVALSLFITIGGALFYLKYAAKTYNVAASVLLTIERSDAYGASSDNMMRVDELIEKDKNLQNEIYFLQSTPLIRSVIEEMDLTVSYYLQEDKIPKELEFSLKELYTDAPFIVIPNKEHLQPVNLLFYVQVLNEESFVISATGSETAIVDFKDQQVVVPSTKFHFSGTYKFGEEIGNTYTSFRMLLNANYNADAYQGKDLFFKFNSNQYLTGAFKSILNVEALAIDATMVDMTLHTGHVQKGVDFLEALVSSYINNNLEEKNYLANKTIEHLDFQLADVSESLGSSEQELQNIRRNSSVMNIDEKAENLYTERQSTEMQLDDIMRRRSYLLQMQDYFETDKDSTGFLAPSAMGIEDPLLSGLIEQLTTLNTERQQIINNNQLKNPRLRTLEISINNMKETIIETLQYSIGTADSELREINSKISGLTREYASLPYTQRKLLGIERKFNLSENVYMSLLEQRIQAQIIKASTLPDCELVEPARYISVRSPKKSVFLIGAIFLGLLFPMLYILGKKLFTTKILTKEELRRYTKLTQIGSIPADAKSEINVIVKQPNSITAESFQLLRSNIIYNLMGKLNQVILVTSTMEGEGKSFSALNIASSLAVTNNKTILVEFDLRRPSELYTRLGVRGLVGVSSFLINKASLEEITISSDVENLDLILAGQIPPNPIELISSKRTDELFAELKKNYDYIVIDTPPYGVLTDSFVLMKYADIKIYVTRLGYVKKRILLSSFEDIESKGIDNIQLLINGDTQKQGSYGKYYTSTKKELKLLKRKSKHVDKSRKRR